MRLTQAQLAQMPERIRQQISDDITRQVQQTRITRAEPAFSNESDLHAAIWESLSATLPCDCTAFHVPNGEKRTEATARKLKRLGTVPGVSDLIVVCSGRPLALEIKTESGALSGSQKEWREKWVRSGGEYVVVRSVDAALKAVTEWRTRT